MALRWCSDHRVLLGCVVYLMGCLCLTLLQYVLPIVFLSLWCQHISLFVSYNCVATVWPSTCLFGDLEDGALFLVCCSSLCLSSQVVHVDSLVCSCIPFDSLVGFTMGLCFHTLGFKFSFSLMCATTRWWSLPTSAPLLTRTSCKDRRHLPLVREAVNDTIIWQPSPTVMLFIPCDVGCP